MADTTQWPLPLDRVQAIVEHLVNDGSREGLILGDELNVAMGASARRRSQCKHSVIRKVTFTTPIPNAYVCADDAHPVCHQLFTAEEVQ